MWFRRRDKRAIEARGVDISKEDEMLPTNARPVYRPSREGEERDTAGQHGRMAPESASGLPEDERTR